MSVLALLVSQFFTQHRETDTTRSRRGYRRSRIKRAGHRHRRRDRTAWGSYVEHAAPVLPPNTCVPGFENEVLVLGKRVRRRQGAEHEWEDDEQDEEEVTDSDVDVEHDDADSEQTIFGEEDTDFAGRTAGSGSKATHAHSKFPKINSLLEFLPTSFSTSSSLFGSTTRPATRLTPDIYEQRRSEANTIVEETSAAIQGDFLDRSNIVARQPPAMAPKAHTWITLWFLLTAPVIIWDASYCFMRPRSFKGGDLHWIWKPYEIYQEVDYVYGVETYNRGDGFTNAQSFMNIVETALNLYYVYAQHVLASPSAPLIGFASAVMTLSKTVLYWLQEYYCGGCAIGHNDMQTLFWFWIVPNGLWLIVPSLIIFQLYKDIGNSLRPATKSIKKD